MLTYGVRTFHRGPVHRASFTATYSPRVTFTAVPFTAVPIHRAPIHRDLFTANNSILIAVQLYERRIASKSVSAANMYNDACHIVTHVSDVISAPQSHVHRSAQNIQ